MLMFAQRHVEKIGGGQPTTPALFQLSKKMDADSEWYPGKVQQGSCHAPALSGAQRSAIARSAMAVEERDEEVTYSRLVGACPKATLNAAAQKPVGEKRVYDVLRADCYDHDPADAWTHGSRMSRAALTEDMKQKRVRFADAVLDRGHTREWLFENLVWSDLCNSVLPRTQKVAASQALAREGKHGLGAANARATSVAACVEARRS